MYSKNLKDQFLGFYDTPSLFKNDILGIEQFEFEEINLDSLDFNKLEITEKIPLGKRVERFFEFYIQNIKRYDLILKNIQIINNNNTLGEIDFILYDNKNKEFIHVELIYKFYIYDDSFDNILDRFIGPNRNDTLVKKLEKLKNHQLPLLYKEETKKYLEDIDLANIKQKICYKANLYFDEINYRKDIEPLNSSCKKGLYIKYENLLNDTHFKELEYYLPHRFDWLCDADIVQKWQTFDEISSEVSQYINLEKSPLVFIKKENIIKQFFILW